MQATKHEPRSRGQASAPPGARLEPVATRASYRVMSREFVTVVSGLPRSGTSMMMRMLDAGGIPPMTDGHRRADPDNPLGYYELEAVKLLPDKTEWLKDGSGKAVKVVSALADKLPAGHQYRVLFMERELEEVLASQRRMLERRGEYIDRTRDEAMAPMFRKHIVYVLDRIRSRKDVRLLVLRHALVLSDTASAIESIDDFLGGGLDRDAMAAAVDPGLWRQRASAPASGG
jgi:hypothetical protein